MEMVKMLEIAKELVKIDVSDFEKLQDVVGDGKMDAHLDVIAELAAWMDSLEDIGHCLGYKVYMRKKKLGLDKD